MTPPSAASLRRAQKCLASRSTPWRPARSPSCAPSCWLARSHSLHRMPQSSWPSSSPFALLPPPRFEGLEECVGCRPVPLDRPARHARVQPHDILRPSLPPIVRCVATLPLLLVPGNCGVRRGWRWRARPALRARRGADRAQADGRVHHAAGGRHSSHPKEPWGLPRPQPRPHPHRSCWAGHERRGRGGGRRRLPPSASPHGRAHRCTRSRPSGRRGGRPTL